MAEVIKMPRMSDTMEEGNIVAWHKKVGDEVEIGDLLAEIETDKATMDFESPSDGFLLHIAVDEGAVAIGGVLAIIGEKGEDFQEALGGDTETPAAPKEEQAPAEEEKSAAVPVEANVTRVTKTVTPTENGRIKASPLAKKMASDSGVNLATVEGTGDNGRIVKKDIEAFLETGTKKDPVPVSKSSPTPAKLTVAPKTPAVPLVADARYEDTPVSQMRKIIARRLGESKFSAPHLYLTIEANMDKAITTRKQLNEIAPTKISFNDIVVKSVATALKQHPNINSSWLGDRIRLNKDINIGVAVAVAEGLLVPVIRNTDTKSLSEINGEVRILAGKAKERKLQPQEMQGNTFTISNLGMFGIEEFTAIINPPDACILAVGGIIQKPIVKDGELAIGNMMKVTLSCDHRVVDGAMGAQFLKTLKGILEDPIRMLV
jgi:pyruvate dehydrogenase E2 component (dihydrolipoamide acetyltransferase)